MNTFDTVKFAVSLDTIYDFDRNQFDFNNTHRNAIILTRNNARLTNSRLGVKSIDLNFILNKAQFEISAKILGESYINNFSRKNFIEALDKINKMDIVKFNPDIVAENLNFYRVDLSKNLIFQEDISQYVRDLYFSCKSKNINSQIYGKQSVTFSKNPLSKRRRLRCIFYDKYKELQRDKTFKEKFDINKYMNILRFETSFNNYYLLRKFFSIKVGHKINYNDIFNFKPNVFKKVFNEIFEKDIMENNNDFNYKSTESLSQLEKKLGMIEICKKFDYDFNKIRSYLKMKVKGNISKYLNTYESIIEEQKKENFIKQKNKNLDLIFNKL
jgi:hypothetical protein